MAELHGPRDAERREGRDGVEARHGHAEHEERGERPQWAGLRSGERALGRHTPAAEQSGGRRLSPQAGERVDREAGGAKVGAEGGDDCRTHGTIQAGAQWAL